MDTPALEDRHPVLDPQQRFPIAELRKEEPGPAAVTGMRGEELGKRFDPPPEGTPSTIRPCRMVPLPVERGGRITPREDNSAGDER
jgi:hypothetical protein